MFRETAIEKGELDILDFTPPLVFDEVEKNFKFDRHQHSFQTLTFTKELLPKVVVIKSPNYRNNDRYSIFRKIKSGLNYHYDLLYERINMIPYGIPITWMLTLLIGVRKDLQIKPTIPIPSAKILSMKDVLGNRVKAFTCDEFAGEALPNSEQCGSLERDNKLMFFTSNKYQTNGQFREPTERELKLLSTYPKDFKFLEKKNKVRDIISRSTPPKMAEAIGIHIKDNILGKLK